MTEKEYYVEVHKLGLSATSIPNVYIDRNREVHSVPLAANYSSEQRVEIIERLKRLMEAY